MKTILISGATGMIGKKLIDCLTDKGYHIHALVRKDLPNRDQIKYFKWNVEERTIDPACIDQVDAIIHLAGAGIGKKPWSKRVRERIVKSRTDSISLIYNLVSNTKNQVKTVISASGTGYYGDRGDKIMTEDQLPSDDFLGSTCLAWERAVAQGSKLGLRCVYLRTGIVLSRKGGALPVLLKPTKFGFSTVLGNGKQWIPWIHLTDVVNLYIFALENEGLHGAYNTVAPEYINSRQLDQTLATQLKFPKWLPPVPSFLIRSVMGQMSDIVLHSTKVSPERVLNAGFQFQYPTITEALASLFTPPSPLPS